jgi:hypothetical protein
MVGRCGPRAIEGLGSVGLLLAVLMSLRQGGSGVRSSTRAEIPVFSYDIAGLRRISDSPAPCRASRAAAKYRAGNVIATAILADLLTPGRHEPASALI